MPRLIMIAMDLGQTVPKEGVVVFLLDMMHLQPYSRGMDCLDMGGKAPVSLVNVSADIARARDHVLRIYTRLLEVHLAKLATINFVEGAGVGIDARGSELGGNDGVDGVRHRVVVRRTRALYEMLALVAQPDRICAQVCMAGQGHLPSKQIRQLPFRHDKIEAQ